MKSNIDDMIKEKQEKKTEAVSITLSKKILRDLEKEQRRLDIKNRSFMIEMILGNYFNLPMENKKEKKENNQ